MTDSTWLFDWQLRQRILPQLAQIDGLQNEWPRAQAVYDAVVAKDLCFDLRHSSPWPSNLCENNSAIELAYTFGGPENCGLRYSYEPTTRPGILHNRYSLFRDRLRNLARVLGDDYDLSPLLSAALIAVPRELMRQAETTVTIAAVHHYRDRPPRIKAYYSCDYTEKPRMGRVVAQQLLALAHNSAIEEQARDFFRQFRPQGGLRMVGLDLEPGKPLGVKIYKRGTGLTKPALRRLIAMAGGHQTALTALQKFQDIFFDGAAQPDLFDLVTIATKPQGHPGLKLYIRPVDFYDDGETLHRLQSWYQWLEQDDAYQQVLRGLRAVAPVKYLDKTRGFFNYISMDLGVDGASKTSVYFSPQIVLTYLARQEPEIFQELS